MGIVLDLIIVLLLVINIIIGYKKGLVEVVFNICAFIIALVVALILYKPVSNIVIKNTNIYGKIRETIVNNNNEEEQSIVKDVQNKTKEQLADVISIKAVNIIVAIVLFIIARIAVILLKTVLEGIAELPIIKQFNQIGGIGYGILKGFLLIYILVTLLFFVNAIVGNNKVSAVVEESFITKVLYENNIIVKKLDK
jgi:uncharacterized membrane protein required for colicin V production